MKYGLTKYLKEQCKLDFQTDVEFASSREVYKAVVTDLKKKGFGSVEHKPPISNEDLQKLYSPENVVFNTNSPCGLQNKVWFDLMLYLCRRGRENQRQMTKCTFAVSKDSLGLEFVYQSVDEADKNHGSDSKPDQTTGEGRMYARTGDVMCPVHSFKKYLSKLHPNLEDLWQRPLDSFEENADIWYCKAPLGKNTLSAKMAEISKIGKLSRLYTNHSIRATTITGLDNAGIEARHIMRASSHKSETSIRSYSCRLSEDKKKMSDCLSGLLQPCTSEKSSFMDVLPDISLELYL